MDRNPPRTLRDLAENGPSPDGDDEVHCLQENDDCEGEIEYRDPLSGTGKSFPRCAYHWDLRLKEQDRIERTYPQHAPSDFDPAYAGEVWSDDDY